MSKKHTIIVSDEVENALKKKALKDGNTVSDLLRNQVDYYVACALYDDLNENDPINTPDLSIKERLEVMAICTNEGIEAGREKVTEILLARREIPE